MSIFGRLWVLIAIGLLLFVWSSNAEATVTGQYAASIKSGQTEIIGFTPSATGLIEANLRLSPRDTPVLVQLFRGDEKMSEASTTTPAIFSFAIDAQGNGQRWTLRIENKGPDTLEGTVILSYPKTLCKELVRDFSFDIRYAADAGVIEDHQCATMGRVIRSLPAQFMVGLRQFTFVPRSANLAGRYSAGAIQLYGWQPGRFYTIVLFHEIAHHIHFQHANIDQFSRWLNLHIQSGSDTDNYAISLSRNSNYAQTNEFEDFAVTVERYALDTTELIERAKSFVEKGKTLLLDKVKLISEFFRYESNGEMRTYMYRVGLGFPLVPVERASVPLTNEGLPDTSFPLVWQEVSAEAP